MGFLNRSLKQKTLILSAVFTFVVACFGVTQIAKALDEPWVRDLDNTEPGRIISHPNGDISAVNCSSKETPVTVSQLNKFGATESEIVDESFYSCNESSAVGKDGTIYGTRSFGATETSTKYGSEIVAYKDGVQQWSHRFNSGDTSCNSMLRTSYALLGPDGNIYVGLDEGYPWCQNKSYLAAITPNGEELYTIPLNANSIQWMGVYNDGIAIVNHYNNLIRFYNFDGSLKNTVDLQLAPEESASGFAIDLEGNIYSPIFEEISSPYECNTKYWTTKIKIYNTTGSVDEFQDIPECSKITTKDSSSSSPHGFTFLPSNKYRSGNENDVISIDKNGNLISRINIPSITKEYSYHFPDSKKIFVDTNGSIIIKQDYYVQRPSAHPKETLITIHDPINNQEVGRIDTFYLNDSPEKGFIVNNIALYNNQIFMLGSVCDDFKCRSASRYTIRSEHLEGLGMDYPRGALIQDSIPEPKINYVALGDSFSSGEGVEPFISSTHSEFNNCHRSLDSYSKLLARDSLLEQHFSLSAFRAYSGAETEQILNPWEENHEAAQIDYLNWGVDVVTMSIGGNDVGFGDYAKSCILLDCLVLEPSTTYAINNDLPGWLDETYSSMKNKTNNDTKFLIVGYPQLFSADEEVVSEDCQFAEYKINQQSTRRVVSELNHSIWEATERISPRFEFVDPTTADSPFIGHELCTTNEPYFHGFTVAPYVNYSFHPNTAGQAAYKDLLKPKFEDLIAQ